MITLTRRQVLDLWRVFRRHTLGFPRRVAAPPVVFRVDHFGPELRVRHRQAHLAVECVIPNSPRPRETIAVPLDVLARMRGPEDSPATFQRGLPGHVEARWFHDGFPRSLRREVPIPLSLPRFPWPPRALQPAPDGLLTALDSLSEIGPRVRIEGAGGGVVARYGIRAELVEGGRMPWDDDVIVPCTKLIGRPEFRTEQLLVGREGGWLALRAGAWTVWLEEQDRLEPPDEDGANEDPEA